MFKLLAVVEERKIKPFLFSSITAAELQQKLLHILAPRTQHQTELSSQSNHCCSSDVSNLKSPTLHVCSFHALDVLQHSVQTTTRGAVYSCQFSLESQREHAEEVARCSSEVFLENCHVWSSLQNLSSVYCVLKTFGDFSLICGLPFVEQPFNWMILILWTLTPSWSEVLVQTMRWHVIHIWCQKLCVKLSGGKITCTPCKNSGNKSCLFSIIACFVFALFIYLRNGSESRVFTFSHFSHKIWVSRRFPYIVNNRWPPNQSNCLKSNNHWTVFNNLEYTMVMWAYMYKIRFVKFVLWFKFTKLTNTDYLIYSIVQCSCTWMSSSDLVWNFWFVKLKLWTIKEKRELSLRMNSETTCGDEK